MRLALPTTHSSARGAAVAAVLARAASTLSVSVMSQPAATAHRGLHQ
jgi:hypothetical protein